MNDTTTTTQPRPSKAAADYMTARIMPMNRKAGCNCVYSTEAYAAGGWRHEAGCPSPMVECLPNAAKLMKVMRNL